MKHCPALHQLYHYSYVMNQQKSQYSEEKEGTVTSALFNFCILDLQETITISWNSWSSIWLASNLTGLNQHSAYNKYSWILSSRISLILITFLHNIFNWMPRSFGICIFPGSALKQGHMSLIFESHRGTAYVTKIQASHTCKHIGISDF